MDGMHYVAGWVGGGTLLTIPALPEKKYYANDADAPPPNTNRKTRLQKLYQKLLCMRVFE